MMLNTEDISFVQQSNNTKILLCSIETDLIDNYLWVKNNNNYNYYIISLNQDCRVKTIIVKDMPITSYSFEMWFCVSGWSQKPIIISTRAMPFMSGIIFYKDLLFYNTVKDMIEKHHEYMYINCGRPMHLKTAFSLDECKEYLSKLLLSYWYSEGNICAPTNISEILMIDAIQKDLRDCVNMVIRDTDLTQQEISTITETIIKYHSKSNTLRTFGDVIIPEAEYLQLREQLYMENSSMLNPCYF